MTDAPQDSMPVETANVMHVGIVEHPAPLNPLATIDPRLLQRKRPVSERPSTPFPFGMHTYLQTLLRSLTLCTSTAKSHFAPTQPTPSVPPIAHIEEVPSGSEFSYPSTPASSFFENLGSPAPNVSPASNVSPATSDIGEVWVSSNPIYDFSQADMVRFQQDIAAFAQNCLNEAAFASTKSSPTLGTSALPVPSISEVSTAPVTTTHVGNGTDDTTRHIANYETTSGAPSPVSSSGDNLGNILDYTQAYGEQFDCEAMQYDILEHVGLLLCQIDDSMLNCRKTAASILRRAEDYVNGRRPVKWLEDERKQRPPACDIRDTQDYMNCFIEAENEDSNPFLWPVERQHAHQCVRWLRSLEYPTSTDLQIQSTLVHLLNYRLDEPLGVAYATIRRLRGDFGPPGHWPPIQTIEQLKFLDEQAGFPWGNHNAF